MDKILNNLGLCAKSRNLISGEDLVVESIKKNKVFYIFLANNASDNTKKKINDKAKFYNVLVNMDYSSEELSHAIGLTNRMVVGITNEGFAKILKK